MEIGIQKPDGLVINPDLDWDEFQCAFSKTGRIRVDNVLTAGSAKSLYQYLVKSSRWRTFVVSRGRLLGTSLDEVAVSDTDREILEYAYEGACSGFASVYDAGGTFADERAPSISLSDGSTAIRTTYGEVPADCSYGLNSAEFLEFVSFVIGVPELGGISTQATRLRPGHFVMFQSAIRTADQSKTRCASLELGLTPDWKPEWGGLLQFRNHHGGTIEGYPPCFNVLDLFIYPQGYWISPIAPFAAGTRLGVSGRVYRK